MAEVRVRRGRAKPTEIPPGEGLTRMGRIEDVQIDALNIDHSYQRDLKQALVEKIGEAWDDPAAGPIVVSRRADGSLWIVNGQHRVAAARITGLKTIIAQVVDGLTPADEAALRLKCNTRAGDTSLETFKAELAAGEPEARDIKRICREFDTRINAHPDQHNGINCVAAVRKVYRLDGGLLLARTFEVIRNAWGSVSGENATTSQILGIAWMIQKHPGELDVQHLTDRLRINHPDVLSARALAQRAIMGGPQWLNFYRAMVECYNDKLGAKRRLDLRSGNWAGLEKVPMTGRSSATAGGR